jgi:hypothetical protein
MTSGLADPAMFHASLVWAPGEAFRVMPKLLKLALREGGRNCVTSVTRSRRESLLLT